VQNVNFFWEFWFPLWVKLGKTRRIIHFEVSSNKTGVTHLFRIQYPLDTNEHDVLETANKTVLVNMESRFSKAKDAGQE